MARTELLSRKTIPTNTKTPWVRLLVADQGSLEPITVQNRSGFNAVGNPTADGNACSYVQVISLDIQQLKSSFVGRGLLSQPLPPAESTKPIRSLQCLIPW